MRREEFDAFIRDNYSLLLRYGLSACSSTDKICRVQDAVQDAILKLYRTYQNNGDLDLTIGYAFLTVRSALVDSYRRDRRMPLTDHATEVDTVRTEQVAPEDIDAAMADDVRAAVAELSLPLQRVIFLKYELGWDNTMISENLLIIKAQVSRDIHRAHVRLRKKLERWNPKSGRRS
ncbi:RNA polymerase sigma factor [Lentzea sp. NPDC051213]|uniref:RNA polymerase sigma factor n=1 Tax=Lentzea sp. NPDC051213 TaxID=3364126 RepID=UPI0037A32C00